MEMKLLGHQIFCKWCMSLCKRICYLLHVGKFKFFPSLNVDNFKVCWWNLMQFSENITNFQYIRFRWVMFRIDRFIDKTKRSSVTIWTQCISEFKCDWWSSSCDKHPPSTLLNLFLLLKLGTDSMHLAYMPFIQSRNFLAVASRFTHL